jgi:cobalamin synthase
MIEYLALILAFPLGIALSKVTKEEKGIYSNSCYFPTIVWVLAFLSAIFLTIDKPLGLSLVFSFLTVLIWWKA